jgi:hypothetical protein
MQSKEFRNKLSHRDGCLGRLYRTGRLQHTSDDPITFDQDARTSINDSVCQVLFDVFNDGVVLGSRLEPEGRDREVFGLLQEAQGDLEPDRQ